MKGRKWLGLLLVLLLAPALAKTTVTVASWGSQSEIELYNQAFKAFMAKNPDIEVKLLHIPSRDYWTKLSAMFAAGKAPDLIFINNINFPAFAAKGLLVPLVEPRPLLQPRPLQEGRAPRPRPRLDLGRLPKDGQGPHRGEERQAGAVGLLLLHLLPLLGALGLVQRRPFLQPRPQQVHAQ